VNEHNSYRRCHRALLLRPPLPAAQRDPPPPTSFFGSSPKRMTKRKIVPPSLVRFFLPSANCDVFPSLFPSLSSLSPPLALLLTGERARLKGEWVSISMGS
jgi:hypothetical protein